MSYKIFGITLPIFSKGYGAIKDTDEYVKLRHGSEWTLEKDILIHGFVPMDMREFKGRKHCAITSLTSIFYYYGKNGLKNVPEDKDELFEKIKEFSLKKRYWMPSYGVNVFVMSRLVRSVWKLFGHKGSSKNRVFVKRNESAAIIAKNEIDNGRPFLISFAGGDYENHTTTCYGYKEYTDGTEKRLYLLLNDNWSIKPFYADMQMLGSIKTSPFAICTVAP